MSTKLTIAVALATHNGVEFLSEQLLSLCAQQRRPDELVVSDDGSEDGTLELLRDFAAQAPFPVRLLESIGHPGFRESFLRAMLACEADVIAICDQDDVWHPAKLAVVGEVFDHDQGVWAVTHRAELVDEAMAPLLGAVWTGTTVRRRKQLPAGMYRPFTSYPGFALAVRADTMRALSLDLAHPRSLYMGDGAPISYDVWAYLVAGSFGASVLLPQRLAQHRRHARAMTYHATSPTVDRWRERLLRGDDPARYARIATAADGRAAYLEQLWRAGAALGFANCKGAERASRRHRLYAAAMRRRAAACGEAALGTSRTVAIASNVVRGDYRSRARAGLGAPSLARDIGVTAARWGRTGS